MKNKNKISRLIIDKYIAGDLDSDKKKEFEYLLQKDEALKEQVRNIQAKSGDFLNKFPDYESLSRELKKESKSTFYKPSRLFLRSIDLSQNRLIYIGAAAVIVILFLFFIIRQHDNPENQYAAKGGIEIGLIIKRSEKMFVIKGNEALFQPLDTLQFFITADKPVYYAIFSKDDSGKIEKYLPFNEIPLSAGNEKGEHVARSLIIDDKRKNETIFMVYSDNIFSIEDAIQRIKDDKNSHKLFLKVKRYKLLK